MSVLVAQDNPLDQYLMRHPDFFFGRSHEHALISPENPYILDPHLLCAAYELPLTVENGTLFGSSLEERLKRLVEHGTMRLSNQRWHLDPRIIYPAQDVNIRSTSSDFYMVVEDVSGRVLERMDEGSAFYQLHPGAIYLHRGDSYLIKELDLDTHVAFAVTTDLPYYTDTRDITDIRIRRVYREKVAGGVKVCLGEVEVSTIVVAYRKKAHFTEEVLEENALDLPPLRFNTVALWFDVPDGLQEPVGESEVLKIQQRFLT